MLPPVYSFSSHLCSRPFPFFFVIYSLNLPPLSTAWEPRKKPRVASNRINFFFVHSYQFSPTAYKSPKKTQEWQIIVLTSFLYIPTEFVYVLVFQSQLQTEVAGCAALTRPYPYTLSNRNAGVNRGKYYNELRTLSSCGIYWDANQLRRCPLPCLFYPLLIASTNSSCLGCTLAMAVYFLPASPSFGLQASWLNQGTSYFTFFRISIHSGSTQVISRLVFASWPWIGCISFMSTPS